MTIQQFTALLKDHHFQHLFISEMGWNNPQSRDNILLDIDNIVYDLKPIAQRNGFGVFACEVEQVPTATTIRKIDSKFRRAANDYICIFYAGAQAARLQNNDIEQQAWAAPINTTEKRDVIIIEYETTADKLQFLYQKIQNLCFDFDEQTTISEVRERIAGEFKVNGEKLTKDFYTGFKQEHKTFADFITGIDDHIAVKENKSKQWYTSVMLNRLMFCYFIQKKGFLNHDEHYLRNKLTEVQQQEGQDRFFGSFYRSFLMHLFHDGLNSPRHDSDFERRFGRIPYLNGGMFDVHQLEKDYDSIDIKDEAFERLFNFFDRWRWHLDYRQTSSGKDINPDVLGYIFEQYINDRAEMGAYYTKEDITGYISKNCIIPFLVDKAGIGSASGSPAAKEVWTNLRQSANRYIYPAVCHGYSADWQQHLPANIAKGISTAEPNLLDRRKDWNTTTPASFGLPTEIWRETIERLQRCDTLLAKIAGGEIREINDFITYNLNITLFVQDILNNTTDHLLIKHFFDALREVTILDPTCGSGAFLFAAMNILEPLYDICLTRMEEFNRQNPNLFKAELDDIRLHYRSNREYFIYKTIILRNLYGVDIMVEATEIAKLRLFLKMVAVVEPDYRQANLGLDPLPDIDFNIRCGNTLVGFATEQELNHSLEYARDLMEQIANQELAESVKQKMRLVADTFELFKSSQLNPATPHAEQQQHKQQLRKRLAELNDLLNHKLMLTMLDANADYDTFLRNYQPFHWLAEFYQIIHDHHGFDIIIGNPPYVGYTRKSKQTGKAVCEIYKLADSYTTLPTSNLYAFCIERSYHLMHENAQIGMIIPISAFANDSMKELQTLIKGRLNKLHISNFHQRPAQLFEGVLQRLSIFVGIKEPNNGIIYTTGINRWYSEHRSLLFQNLTYATTQQNKQQHLVKIGSEIEASIFEKYSNQEKIIKYIGGSDKNNSVYYRTAGGGYWVTFLYDEFDCVAVSNKHTAIRNDYNSKVFSAALNSNLFWWYYAINYDLFNFKDYMIFAFQFTYSKDDEVELIEKSRLMEKALRDNANFYTINSKTNGATQTVNYQKGLTKKEMDEIDKVLAAHYGFTDEELDFIINYDIKYRMGDKLSEE